MANATLAAKAPVLALAPSSQKIDILAKYDLAAASLLGIDAKRKKRALGQVAKTALLPSRGDAVAVRQGVERYM